MKNFDWTRFTKKIAINAALSAIYDAWTKPVEIEKWFLSNADFTDVSGNAVDKNASIQAGNTYIWRWFLYDEVEQGKILDANGKDLIRFSFAGNCIVTVHLTEDWGYTIVELTQENIPTDDDSRRDIRLGCASGWAFYLVNLKSVYEGGLDLRNKDTNLKPMVNN